MGYGWVLCRVGECVGSLGGLYDSGWGCSPKLPTLKFLIPEIPTPEIPTPKIPTHKIPTPKLAPCHQLGYHRDLWAVSPQHPNLCWTFPVPRNPL